MVGVPGRSKGCAECRKRKKGCDLKKPSCTRCVKARVRCSGYDSDRAFIFVKLMNEAPTKELGVRPKLRDVVPPVTVQRSLSQSAYQEKYLELFWDLYLHQGPHYPAKGYRPRQHVGAWVASARDLYREDPALHKALMALSLTTVGKRDNQQWMVEEGLKLHCGSLNDLTAGLESPARSLSEPFLLTARTLGMYEVLHGTDDVQGAVTRGRSWRGHTIGLMSMFLQRTPEMHVDGRAHELFADARIVFTIDAVLARKRSPFSDTRWRAIPWTKKPKAPKDFLYDILNDVSGLLEDADLANSCQDPSQKAELQHRVIQDCWNIDSDLAWWFTSFADKQKIADVLSWGIKSPSHSDFPVAHLMCSYWAACLLTYGTLRNMVSPSTLADLPERTDPRAYCKNIIDITELFFHPSAGNFWMHSLVFPLGISFLYLLATEANWREFPSLEAQKLDDYLGRGGDLNRLRMRNFVKSILQAACPRIAVYDRTGDPDAWDEGFADQGRAWFGIEPVIVS